MNLNDVVVAVAVAVIRTRVRIYVKSWLKHIMYMRNIKNGRILTSN